MKFFKKLKIELIPVLGIIDVLLLILFFLTTNLTEDSTQHFQENRPYSLFYQLYSRLGYRLRYQYLSTLPPQQGDMLIYFDCDLQKDDLDDLIKQWVKPGGGLFIAGMSGECHHTVEVETSQIDTFYIKEKSEIKSVLSSERKYKHFSKSNDLGTENIILYSEAGPLLYQTTRGAGRIFVLTDSLLLTDDYLKKEEIAIMVNDLLRPYYKKRIYLVRANLVQQDRNIPLLALLFKDKMFFISMQLIWLVLLFIAWQGIRFGEPQLLNPYAKRSLSEHLRAVGAFYQKTNALSIIEHINLEYFINKYAKATGYRFKTTFSQGELEKVVGEIEKIIPSLSRDQIRQCFQEDKRTTSGRIQNKERNRAVILEALKR